MSQRTFNRFQKKRKNLLDSLTILNVGCGSGDSPELILKKHNPGKLIAFTLMPEQISLAGARNIPVDFFVGNVKDIQIRDESCGAAFVFGIIHHIQDRLKALYVISGVLKDWGYCLIEPDARFISWVRLEQGFETGFEVLE